jgi:outer membrane receptor protein involved in Fe transport
MENARLSAASSTRCPRVALLTVAVATVLTTALASAQGQPPPVAGQPQAQSGNNAAQEPVEEVVIFGRSLELVGTAEAASEGTVGGADLLVRPMLRVAELLEAVPGMVAVQHSGSGKANQYFLRGFNLDHGTDFTTYVDGVPLNLRSHGHGQGYLDINGLLPETVDRIDYRKGPYRADSGDFAMAGSAYIRTIARLDTPFAALESGEGGWLRLAAGGTTDLANGAWFTGLIERKHYDGPWELEEGLEHTSLWGKYLKPTDFGMLAVTVSGYDGNWHPTEQIPERAIGTAVCEDAFCVLDPTADGNTRRWIAGVQLDGDVWSASAYAQYYDWFMQSNPTYDFQINQFDRRWTTGGSYERTTFENAMVTVTVGGDVRYDDIGNVGVDEFDAGAFVANIGRNSIQEASLGAFVEASLAPTDRLRFLLGARADVYDFDVTAKNAGSFEGHVTDSRASPKVGIAYTVNDSVELYGNWGRGFHSNDARGVVNPVDPVAGLAPGTGYEAGARFELGALKLTSAYWWLNLDSELIFVGDSNSVEPRGGSRREGYELAAFWQPVEWLGLDAVYTGSRGRYVDNPDGRRIEGSVEHAGQFGISAIKDRWEASLRVRYLGEYALTPDNARRAEAQTSVGVRGAYRFGKAEAYAELLNVFDEDGKDIVYWYEAHVAGLDPPGLTSDDIDCDVVNCRISRAEEPRTLRVGIKFEF